MSSDIDVLQKIYRIDQRLAQMPFGSGNAFTGYNKDVMGMFTSDKKFLQSILPKGSVLADSNPFTGTATQWPVLVQFSQAQLKPTLVPFITSNYLEFSLLIPYVMVPGKNNPGPYCYVSILFLDNFFDTIGAEIFWGYNKHISKINISNDGGNIVDNEYKIYTYDMPVNPVEGDSRYMYIDTIHNNTGNPVTLGSLSNFSKWYDVFNQPCIEYIPGFGLVTSNFSATLTPDIQVQPKQMMMKYYFNQFDNNYLPGSNNISIPPITQSEMGALYFEFNWALSYPKLVE